MTYAAHISNYRIQTVEEHCKNTAQLCADYCSLFGAENIGRLAGLLHDAGKLCTDFDMYIRKEADISRGEIDHSYAGAKYITEKKNTGATRLIARVIISHHGLHDWVDENCKDYYNIRISNTNNYEQIKDNINSIIDDESLEKLLLKAENEYQALRMVIKSISKGHEDFAFYMGMLERIIESSLIDADRTDTASFMNNENITDKIDNKDLWSSAKTTLMNKLAGFNIKKDKISIQRKSISDRCAAFAKNDVKICKLIVPTGGGKTLSSLRFAIEYCLEHNLNKIIYTAPFMSILEQNSDEIRTIIGEDNFTEHHSNALAEKSDDGELHDYELHTERWDQPVIATTMVQLLNSFFLGKTTSVRRMHRLSKSVLIIDEAQSIPLKCINIFDLAINFFAYICGTTVVLCTATQPETDNVTYPIMVDNHSSMTGDCSYDFEIFRRTEIIPNIDPYGYSYDEAADYCSKHFSKSGNLLVIVNTKSAALKLYNLLRDKWNNNATVIHLSTNMCPQHRRDKIDLIRSLLKTDSPVICITTQLIEAGVDISFKCVVRSLAGIDNAIQAAGRCNRNGENALPCPVYLIKLKEEKLGSLKEIISSQSITQQMCESNKYKDISSINAVSDYFRNLYHKERENLSYSVEDNETLINYLSLNSKRYEILSLPKTCSKYEAQAFKTAGKLFKVIDNNTLDVIVPYNDEAKELIKTIDEKNEDATLLLRKAQKFSVSLFSSTKRSLYEKNAIYLLHNNVVILNEAFYNNDIGIDVDGAINEVLIF